MLSTERDHILGLSFSPRANVTHISIWTKHGDNQRSILLMERAILSGLSPDLRPKSPGDFNYRKHVDKMRFGNTGGAGNGHLQRRNMHMQPQPMGSILFPLPVASGGSGMMTRPGPIRALTVG